MKRVSTSVMLFLFCAFSLTIGAQNITGTAINVDEGEYFVEQYNVDNPEITAEQYEILNKRCEENRKLLGLNTSEKGTESVSLEWPLQAAAGFTDCSYYSISAHVDHNTTSGVYQDYNCGTIAYDGHKGTDIMPYPFGFYKMDNDQVEIIAAAAGTILDKDDGNFDRNCSSNTLPANYVIVQHADGSVALYWHMKSGSVTSKAIGQNVVVGEYLGVPGSSGSSSGPHLHFEIWSDGTSATYNDPYAGTCNTINLNSWWANQKPYTEPSILKASVHTTDVVFPGCPTTETLNESTSYIIPFQGSGLPPGYAKFYIFIRNTTVGMTANMSILNPGGSTFSSWTYSSASYYNASYAGWSKLLPTIEGTYTFQATYNGITCFQDFDIVSTTTGVATISDNKEPWVYPNPSNGEFGIELGTQHFNSPSIEIFNILGEKVFQSVIPIDESAITPGLQNGIYFYQIKDDAEFVAAGKLVMQ